MNLQRLVIGLAFLLVAAAASARIIVLPVEQRLGPLELESHVIGVEIKEQVAVTAIDMQFRNPHGQQLEAEFLFPVPRGAQVTDFEMLVNGKRVQGEVLEKKKACQIYTDIVRRMRDPGLIEMIDQDLFKARVFPVPARGSMRVWLKVTQVLERDGSLVSYEWPLQAPDVRPKPGAKAGEFSLKLDIQSKTPISAVYSPTHEISKSGDGDGDRRRTAILNDPDPGPHKSFKCFYTLAKDDIGMSLLTHRLADESGTFLLLISPALEAKDMDEQPIDFTFVVDTSGSMNGEKIKQAKEALKQCLAGLRPIDRFNIVRFSTEVEVYADEFTPAKEKLVEKASAWVDKLRPVGGTNIHEALVTALKAETKADHLHTVLFLTDGMPTIGVTDLPGIMREVESRNKSNVRVFVCGVGSDVNAKLCDEIANKTRAKTSYIVSDKELEVKVAGLFDKIRLPVLTGLELDFGKMKVTEMYPKELPDLFAGSQLTVFGRYDESGPVAVKLNGKVAGKKREFVYEEKLAKVEEENDFVETLWGTRKIGYLLENIRQNGETGELREEVIRLAKQYGVVTPYTSYLVTEDSQPVVANVRPGHFRGGPVDVDALSEGSVDGSRTFIQAPGMISTEPGRGGGDVANGISGGGRLRGAEREEGGRLFREFSPSPNRSKAPAGAAAGGRWSNDAFGSPRDGVVHDPDNADETLNWSYGDKDAGWKQDATGEKAIAISKATADYKGKSRLDKTQSVFKTVGKRTFEHRGGVWTDEAAKASMKEIKIKSLSAAYFELLSLQPDLKNVLALGNNIVVVVNGSKVVIGDDGLETLDDETKKLLK